MDARDRRAITVLLALVVVLPALVLLNRGVESRPGERVTAGEPPEITAEIRRAGLRFAPGVTEADREWVLGAVASARPEAQRLVDEVDGLVEVQVHADDPEAIGKAHVAPEGLAISLDTGALNGDRAFDRNAVVMHELGHIVDYLLVPDALMRELDRGIPQVGTCEAGSEPIGACTAIEERFADTFAKWALRGAVSLAGSGYHIPAPASLEDWGAPLGLMAARLAVKART
jgi:hypothetical protein